MTRGDFPEETNGTSRAREVPASGGAAATLEEEAAVRESVAWEMLGEALRTLEGVGQTGADVLWEAQQASDAAREVGVLSGISPMINLPSPPFSSRYSQRVGAPERFEKSLSATTKVEMFQASLMA